MIKNNKFSLIISLAVLVISLTYTSFSCQRRPQVYSVNLGKILSAQMLMAGRMAQMGDRKQLWMATIKESSSKVRKVIYAIAGNHLVVVTPAVIQGATNITPEVLKRLGLPTTIPRLSIKQKDVMPQLLPDKPAENKKKKGAPTWLQP